MLTTTYTFAQAKKKSIEKEKPPTQKEMAEMMKEAQSAINELDPETKKMMDSMGIKMPSFKNIPKVSNEKLAAAWDNENRVVPKKDITRIASISRKVDDANIKAYILGIQKKSLVFFSAEVKATSEKVYAFIKSNSKNTAEAGNMACAIWITGKQDLALKIMGDLCSNDPTNTDNLNNYASMLSMMGGQHLAIPLLNNLNIKYPKNSTMLNNLGQAWFGLGDMAIAEKYLDSAIRIYAYHPQANLTKASIEESRGNITKAIEAIKKSIKHSYTNEKEDKLRQLGYEIELKDVSIPFRPTSDPLGLEKLKQPDYPTSLSELKMLKPLWQNFNDELDQRLSYLQSEMNQMQEGLEKTYLADKKLLTIPLHVKKVSLVLAEIQKNYEVRLGILTQKGIAHLLELEKMRTTRPKIAVTAPCETFRKEEDAFLNSYNSKQKAHHNEFLKMQKNYFNEMAYYSQYTLADKIPFDMLVLEMQINWISLLKEYQPLLIAKYELLECVENKKGNHSKLAEFDLVACNYNDTMNLGVIAFYQNCSRMTSKLNLKFVEYSRLDNFERAEGDTYESSTLKISVEQGFDKLKLEKGPLKLEAKIAAAIELEFDRQGIKDVNLILEAKAGAGHNVLDQGLEATSNVTGKDVIDNTVEVGLEGRISLVSGKGSVNVNVTGRLESIRMMEW